MNMKDIRVRFAPSPTGLLHLGSCNRAVLNYLFAVRQGGTFILRLDDTDLERSTEENAVAIQEDLRWLGLEWDEFYRQSERMERYAEAFEALKKSGRLYPCYETPEELDIKRKVQLSRGLPPIYDRAALELTDEQRQVKEAEGIEPHWRFKLEHKEITWHDLCRGEVRLDGATMSDPVLFKSDGRPIFTIATVVDDRDLNISHVIRGDDHVPNTAMQVQIFEALGAPLPQFGHYPLMLDKEGKKLSKRTGALGMSEVREMGFEPLTVSSVMEALGTSHAPKAVTTLKELAADFDLGDYGRASPRFDPEIMWTTNAKILHVMPFEQARHRLAELGMEGFTESFWEVVRANITQMADAKDWWDLCQGKVEPVIEDEAYTSEAANLLPAEPWDRETWGQWTASIKEATGRKGRELFMPLRLALTAQSHGPELQDLLPLIGFEKAKARLLGQAA